MSSSKAKCIPILLYDITAVMTRIWICCGDDEGSRIGLDGNRSPQIRHHRIRVESKNKNDF